MASKKLILKSSDGDEFEIEESIAVQSGTIKNMVEDDYTLIPLPNVNTQKLILIIEYMKKHGEKTDSNEEEIKEFDKEFLKDKRYNDMFDLIVAANYLHIIDLMNLICQTIADRIKHKSVIAIRQIFGITNDFTSEEEENIREENKWAHEGEEIDESLD
ncbi:SKP1-like protein 11-like [Solanum lycopersicum]|uniref:SKP1-like protein n=1 Tax=Solanum lycopersicum TaxID=4081 RepID=K4D583_SOLLC|nr:SKP1-like protein 11-like [Solanum lycopersicum]AIG62967.1 SLF-interacting SKP1-like protein 2 [Solanum lycopersicum]